MVNVLDFGADPTGKRDSGPAIQAATEACCPGQAVVMPAGTYLVSSLPVVAARNNDADESQVPAVGIDGAPAARK